MKYKVGDKARVRKDLELGETYGGQAFVDTMQKFKGKVVEIEEIIINGFYKIKGNEYTWSDKMFEDAGRYIIIAEDSNKVIAKMDGKVGIAKCSPEDEFNFFVGAKLALERLEEQFKPYVWLKPDVRYYVPFPADDDLFRVFVYSGSEPDTRRINLGLAFKTREKAIEAARKMLAVLK